MTKNKKSFLLNLFISTICSLGGGFIAGALAHKRALQQSVDNIGESIGLALAVSIVFFISLISIGIIVFFFIDIIFFKKKFLKTIQRTIIFTGILIIGVYITLIVWNLFNKKTQKDTYRIIESQPNTKEIKENISTKSEYYEEK